jgi:Ca2+-transporting ATPase
MVLQLAVLYTPLNQYFGTVPLGLEDWGIIGAVLVLGFPAYLAVVRAIKRYLPLDEDPGENPY